MSDKDAESLMKNLKEDAKRFRSVFNSAVGKRTIRKTSQEKDAKAPVERFQKQTEGLLSEFQNKQKADQSLPAVQSSAEQIDKLLTTTAMGEETSTACAKIKTELATIPGQFATATPR